jgi:hypothetical protein
MFVAAGTFLQSYYLAKIRGYTDYTLKKQEVWEVPLFRRSRDSSVDIAMRYTMDGWRKGKIFLFSTASRSAPIQWVPGALSPGIKRLRCEAGQSPLFPHMSSWLNA